jgi:XTP/dITP diphosphohydrolase
MKLLIATGNRHKFQEIAAILQVPHLQLVGLPSVAGAPVVEEDGDTFEANASKKARELARYCGCWTLADDSGLEVAALGGAPGVWSARYAGLPSHDGANNAKLLSVMSGVEDRRARFRCVIALSDPEGESRTVAGSCEGRLLQGPRGVAGFGYDPLFVPDGYDRTFAELEAEIKNRISHRARALADALKEWGGFLAGEPETWGGR